MGISNRWSPANIGTPSGYEVAGPNDAMLEAVGSQSMEGYAEVGMPTHEPLPFVPQQNRLPHPNNLVRPRYAHTITRGHITRYEHIPDPSTFSPTNAVKPSGRQIRFNFLMNPQEISLGYNIDPALANIKDVEDPTTPLRMGTTSLSFSVMLDRSFEVLEPKGSKWYQPRGVLDDFKVLEALLAPTTTGDAFMTAAPNYLAVVFGAMRFFGQVQGVNASITHHTHKMVPTRAVVSFSFLKQAPFYTPAPGADSGADLPTSAKESLSTPSDLTNAAPRPQDPRILP